jgi:predicted PurR-regulated permease PerM
LSLGDKELEGNATDPTETGREDPPVNLARPTADQQPAVALLTTKSFLQIVALIVATLATLWLLQRLRELLVIFVVSLFFSFALEPAVNFMARHGIKRGVATGIAFLALFAIAGVFISAIVPAAIGQVSQFIQSAPQIVESVASWLSKVPGSSRLVTIDPATQSVHIQEGLRDWLLGRAQDVLAAGTMAIGLAFKMLMVFFFTFYLVADGPRFRRRVCSLLPPERQKLLLHVWEISIQRTGGFIYSKVLMGTFSAIVHTFFFFFVGVPYPLAMGMWMGFVSQFIPVVGTYLAVAVPLVLAVLKKPSLGLLVLGFALIFQQIENYLITPKISEHTMDLHPAVAFGAAVAGGYLFGAVGAVLGIPVAAIVQAIASSYLQTREVIASPLVVVDGETMPLEADEGSGSPGSP